jgi:Sap, sulfolipid-1-addressing protein
MANAIGIILPEALGVAISPLSISVIILMLLSKRARSNSFAFLVGWVLALAAVGSIVLLLTYLEKISAGGIPSSLAGVLKLLLGLLLLFLAIRQWRSRPGEGEEPQMPKWMKAIDQFTTRKAIGLAVLTGVKPKNLILTLTAALSIAQAPVSGAAPWIVMAIFIILASLTIAIPVLYYLIAGESATSMLTSWKVWLVANNATVMFILLLVFGVLLFGVGLGGLIGWGGAESFLKAHSFKSDDQSHIAAGLIFALDAADQFLHHVLQRDQSAHLPMLIENNGQMHTRLAEHDEQIISVGNL